MKKICIIFALILSFSCASNNKKENVEADISLTVSEMLADPDSYTDKKIQVTGMVTHICRHGGQKLFIAGDEEDAYLRVNTDKNITEFPMDIEGRVVEFTGILILMDKKTTIAVIKEEGEHHNDTGCVAEQNPGAGAGYYLLAERYNIIR